MRNNEFVMNVKTTVVIIGILLFTICSFMVYILMFKRNRGTQTPIATIFDTDIILAKYKSLTPKEREISLLLASNLSNKEISNRLCIGISTVKTHINNIYNKLGVTSRTDFLNILPCFHAELSLNSTPV